MRRNIVLIVAVILVTDKSCCGVIEGVYDKVSNTTLAVKDDVYSWWSYGVDSVMGDDVHNKDTASNGHVVEEEKQAIGRIYNKVKGGVSSGYMKIHDLVLGEDSDPNKGIIRTLYERAMKRLSDIKSFVFGNCCHDDKPGSQTEEDVKEQVLKLIFSNKTDLINTESERIALDSLRSKLTQTGDEVLKLADNERDLIKKAYDSVRRKSDEFLAIANKSTDTVKNKINENIEKTQEFIQDASKKVSEGAENVEKEVKKSADDIQKQVQSEN